jgi:hypothetical protein
MMPVLVPFVRTELEATTRRKGRLLQHNDIEPVIELESAIVVAGDVSLTEVQTDFLIRATVHGSLPAA